MIVIAWSIHLSVPRVPPRVVALRLATLMHDSMITTKMTQYTPQVQSRKAKQGTKHYSNPFQFIFFSVVKHTVI